MINTLLKAQKGKEKSDVTKFVDENGISTSSAEEISEKFNRYFGNIAESSKTNTENKTTSPSD